MIFTQVLSRSSNATSKHSLIISDTPNRLQMRWRLLSVCLPTTSRNPQNTRPVGTRKHAQPKKKGKEKKVAIRKHTQKAICEASLIRCTYLHPFVYCSETEQGKRERGRLVGIRWERDRERGGEPSIRGWRWRRRISNFFCLRLKSHCGVVRCARSMQNSQVFRSQIRGKPVLSVCL